MKDLYIYHFKKDWFNFKGVKLLSTSEVKDFLKFHLFDMSASSAEDFKSETTTTQKIKQ